MGLLTMRDLAGLGEDEEEDEVLLEPRAVRPVRPQQALTPREAARLADQFFAQQRELERRGQLPPDRDNVIVEIGQRAAASQVARPAGSGGTPSVAASPFSALWNWLTEVPTQVVSVAPTIVEAAAGRSGTAAGRAITRAPSEVAARITGRTTPAGGGVPARARQSAPTPSASFWDTLTSAGRATRGIASTRASTTSVASGVASGVAAERQRRASVERKRQSAERIERQRQRLESARAAAGAAAARSAQAEAAVKHMQDVAAGRAAAVTRTVTPDPIARLTRLRVEQYERERPQREAAERSYQERLAVDRAAAVEAGLNAQAQAQAERRRLQRETEHAEIEAREREQARRAKAEAVVREQQALIQSMQPQAASRYDFATLVASPQAAASAPGLRTSPLVPYARQATQGAQTGGRGLAPRGQFNVVRSEVSGLGAQQRRDLHMGAF